MEEDEIIKRAKEGDVDSFNCLVEIYQRQVYSLSLRMLGNASAAEDAAQDAFLSAFRGIGRFRGGSFRAWLFRIATNACYDQLRARGRRPTTPIDDMPMELESDQPSPEDFAVRREIGEKIKEEIARVTGSSLGTVKSRINRGRGSLRHYLERYRELLP